MKKLSLIIGLFTSSFAFGMISDSKERRRLQEAYQRNLETITQPRTFAHENLDMSWEETFRLQNKVNTLKKKHRQRKQEQLQTRSAPCSVFYRTLKAIWNWLIAP
jgi:hypothetical protein